MEKCRAAGTPMAPLNPAPQTPTKAMNRNHFLHEIQDNSQPWDVAIIGGGATGLGVAVDAATRGFRTLLVEAEDFAKGTSSRSTKLVHGGVRYLEQGDIPLVLEALRERGLLHQNAPHLVHHLSFIVPRYQWWEGPFFGIGLKVYDALAGKLNLAPSRMLSRDETMARIPNIESNNLQGGVEYFDGQFDDARLAVALARTAAHHGATMLNYVRVIDLKKSGAMVTGFTCRDAETHAEYEVNAKVVINATGVFADDIRQMDEPGVPAVVQPSQGVHLVFDRSFLRGDSAIMVPHTDDGRVLFVIPWHDRVLVGTTDTPMKNTEIEPTALDSEIGFILRNAARYLAKDPSESDILSIFAGQRPLVRPPKRDGSETKSISRNHEIMVSGSGLVTIAGGKWTTYRKMAEDTLNHAIMLSGLDDNPCVTANLQLHGWRSPSATPLPPGLAELGADAAAVQQMMDADAVLSERIHPELPYPKALVIWAVRNEQARTIEDVLSRRTRILLLNAAAAVESAPRVADLMAAELGRDKNWIESQLQAFTALAKNYQSSSRRAANTPEKLGNK
jgi:glycerol-3-phosphate dehydrogenase